MRTIRSRRLDRWLQITVTAACVCALTPVSAYASQPPRDPKAQESDKAPFVLETRRLAKPLSPPGASARPSRAMWVWPEERRAFFLANGTSTGFRAVVALDTESGAEVARRTLDPPGYTGQVDTLEGSWSSIGGNSVAAVDRGAGRLFVAYQTVQVPDGPAAIGRETANGQACIAQHDGGIPCVAGVHVLDARSLAPLGTIPLRRLDVGGTMLGPQLLAMTYVDPRPDRSGKLLLLLQEYANSTENNQAGGKSSNPRQYPGSPTLTYLVQMDPDAGRQDWAVRLDACRGNRELREGVSNRRISAIPHLAAVLSSPGDDAIFVACHANTSTFGAAVVRVPLDRAGRPDVVPVELLDQPAMGGAVAASDSGLSAPVGVSARQQSAVYGPDRVYSMLADPTSGRFLLRVLDGTPMSEVWWVFDIRAMQFIATIGIGGPVDFPTTSAGIDPDTGRFYVLASDNAAIGKRFAGGLFVADIRRTPIPQAVQFSEFADVAPRRTPGTSGFRHGALVIESAQAGRDARVWFPEDLNSETLLIARPYWRLITDQWPLSTQTDTERFVGRTLDIDEVEGATQTVLDGAARGYGLRALLVGGAEAAARVGPVDPIGNAQECHSPAWGGSGELITYVYLFGFSDEDHYAGPCYYASLKGSPDNCLTGNRDVAFALVGPDGPAVVDAAGSRGGAKPVALDSATAADAEAPASRCAEEDWDSAWGRALLGRPPVAEPSSPANLGKVSVQCVSSEESAVQAVGDPVTSRFSAVVDCDPREASGHAYVRGVELDGVSVAEALASFRIYVDARRGVVSRVESVVRGVRVAGAFTIDTVRGTAESWANGRAQPVADADREVGYVPNCDMERTAGTCFTRHVFGVRSAAFSCGPCGEEARLADGLTKALGANGAVRFREPDPTLAVGADNGFAAAVQKAETERFADVVLNNDLLQTVLPSLEVIRYTNPSRQLSFGGPRGRQIYQFAGVEVSSSYSIQCLLVYDEATNTCAAQAEAPGSITLSLKDPEGDSLAGGAFEIRADRDGDAVVGLADTVVPQGACLTAEDGTGTCTFDNLQPGDYLVTQTAAPVGYAKSPEPFAVDLASGEARTVTFTNAPDTSLVQVTAADEAGQPLAGAIFAVFGDPDADGRVAPDAKPAATCTTDAAGTCSMRVPAGAYVLVQTHAPAGLAPMGPVAFTFASAGQTASVGVVNSPLGVASESPAAASAPVVGYADPPPVAPPAVTVEVAQSPTLSAEPPPDVSLPAAVGGTVVRVIRAPGDALRLLSRDPAQAAAWTASLALFTLALLAVRRRALLAALAVAPTALLYGGGPPLPPRGGRPRGASGAASTGASASAASTAVLDRPGVAGAAPSSIERVTVDVVVATASPVLALMAVGKLEAAERVHLVGEVDDLDKLRRALDASAPDVLVVDVTLPTEGPDDIFDTVTSWFPAARVVALIPADADIEELVFRSRQTGIAGILAADDDIANGHLAFAVRSVALGKPCYGPTVQALVLKRLGRPTRRAPRPDELTPRELEIARLAAGGLRRSDIAKQLFLSHETVKLHLRAARKKLGITDPRDSDGLRKRLEASGLLDVPAGE